MSGKQTPYHLVEASLWPLLERPQPLLPLLAGSCIGMAIYGVVVFGLGFALVQVTMFMWWRDIIVRQNIRDTY